MAKRARKEIPFSVKDHMQKVVFGPFQILTMLGHTFDRKKEQGGRAQYDDHSRKEKKKGLRSVQAVLDSLTPVATRTLFRRLLYLPANPVTLPRRRTAEASTAGAKTISQKVR